MQCSAGLQPEPDHRKAAARYLASAASGCKPAEHHTVGLSHIEPARSRIMRLFCAVRIMHMAQ
jgi:hypothetical protein